MAGILQIWFKEAVRHHYELKKHKLDTQTAESILSLLDERAIKKLIDERVNSLIQKK